MGKKDRPKKNRYRAVIAIVIAGIVFLAFPRAEERNFRELLTENAELELLNALCPVIAAAGDNGRLFVSGWIFPFLGYQSKTKTAQLAQENSDMVEKILLAEILRKQYGYNVMHHMGQYDVEKRDYAYSNSLPALEAILKENPSIEVVIDLHRDEVAEGTRLVTEIGGKKMARFMFFNGLSRTRRLGDIDSLPNKNIADNLAFSFQMQVLCNEYYPGLTRRIYLKGYRYNMHLKQRYLLIEMGAQTNTYEECMNSCVPLAQMLDLELSGKTDFTLDPEKG